MISLFGRSGMSGHLLLFVFGLVLTSFLAGWSGERLRARRSRRVWKSKYANATRTAFPSIARTDRLVTDPADQLRLVMNATFEKRRLMSKAEARVFYAAEKAIRDQRLTWRAMAQVSLGEVLSSPDARAYSTINSKRVDVLLVSSGGDPIAAIEYQGSGHYQGAAPARDAVKREALRKAGVGYIEVTPEHGPDDVAHEIARIAR